MAESGVDRHYFGVLEGRYDVLVESEVERLTEFLVAEPGLVDAEELRADRDRAAGADESQRSWVRIFRLPDQAWTQIFCPASPSPRRFELGRRVSLDLGVRSVHIELAEDAWEGYLFFDRGKVKEASVVCVGCEFQDLAEELGMPVPEIDDEDSETLYCPSDWFHSELRRRSESIPLDELSAVNFDFRRDLETLARQSGFWVDAGEPVWDSKRGVQRLDLLFARRRGAPQRRDSGISSGTQR